MEDLVVVAYWFCSGSSMGRLHSALAAWAGGSHCVSLGQELEYAVGA